MKLNILIGGKAGQGINKISEIVARIMNQQGYFSFNYRDYPSLIRGGHNFNVLTISDEPVFSNESMIDIIVPMDDKTGKIHESELKKGGIAIDYKKFENLGRNLNIALSGALVKILGIDKRILLDKIEKEFHNKEATDAAESGFNSQEQKFSLKKIKNSILTMNGSAGVAQGAVNSGLNLYISYPMTPATGVLHELAGMQEKCGHIVFLPENEIAAVNIALGASFAGAKAMTGTSGGGFDLMTEGLSLQGQSEIPLVVFLASRPGPGTGVPTYSMQDDLDVALRGGHGEFPRIVIAPGDPIESIEKTNEAFYLSEKFGALSIILSDKHLAESEFSSDKQPAKPLKVEIKRKVAGEGIIKASSYEHDEFGNTAENAETAEINGKKRLEKYNEIKKECERFEMIKIHGNLKSKNLIVGWGSTKGAILDAIKGLDYKFLQVIYMKPLSDEIRKEIQSAKKVILIECNLTGQLGRLLREKTGISIKNRILKYDTLPFLSDKLREEIEKIK